MSPEERMQLGEEAKFLLDHAIFRRAMDACLVHCQMRWANTKPDDTVSRETLFHQFTAVNAIEEMLKNYVEDAKRAEREERE